MVTALLVMTVSAWATVDVADRVRQTRNILRRNGVADRPFIKRHLAAIEAFEGNVGNQRDFLIEPANRNVEFAGLYHFVNGGIQPSIARRLLDKGVTVADLPAEQSRSKSPLSTLAKHITKTIKTIEAYRRPQLGPTLLTWTRGLVLANRNNPSSCEMQAVRTVVLHQHRRDLNADAFCRSLFADVEAGLSNG